VITSKVTLFVKKVKPGLPNHINRQRCDAVKRGISYFQIKKFKISKKLKTKCIAYSITQMRVQKSET